MEERISKLKGKNIEIILMQEERKVRFFKSEETVWTDSIRKVNARTMCFWEAEEREKGAEGIFKKW